jgi:RNA polymerase sigma factor (sigma-70 family)
MPRTVASMSHASARRHAPSGAPRPHIALVLECAVACVHATVASLTTDVACELDDVVMHAGRGMADRTDGDAASGAGAALVAYALRATSVAIERLCSQTGVQPRDISRELHAWLPQAAHAAGLPQDIAALGTHASPIAQRLLALARVVSVRGWITDGGLGALLRATWKDIASSGDHHQLGALATSVGRHTVTGVDADRLVWDAVRCEAQRHMGLVYLEANRLAPRYRDVAAGDLVGHGWQGLRAALRSYDPCVAAFSTYACPRINGAIRDGLRAEQPIPKRLTTLVNSVARAEQELTHSLARAPQLSELAERVGVDLDKLALLPRLADPASLDAMIGATGDVAGGTLDDEAATFAMAAARSDAVAAALDQLPLDEAVAIRLQLLDGRTAAETAAALGLSVRQLRGVRARGLVSLQTLLADWAPAAA